MELGELTRRTCFGMALLTKIDRGEWWRSLPVFSKKLAERIGLAGFGVGFLWVKWWAERLKLTSAWEFRDSLFDIASVVGGCMPGGGGAGEVGVCECEGWPT